MAFSIYPTIIARLPSINFLEELTVEKVMALLEDPFFCEAIYLASPILYKEAIKLKEEKILNEKEIKKITYSLTRYTQRMYSRCTPFGLFAGCTTLNWGAQNKWEKEKKIIKHTRLDMHYLCALAEELAKKEYIKPTLKFFANNSCYVLGEEIRYVDYHYKNSTRKHSISAVNNNDYINAVLTKAQHGATISELANLLVQMDCDALEANEYIETLIENQLLKSELEPAITGDGFLKQIITTLQNINTKSDSLNTIIKQLNGLEEELIALDKQEYNTYEAYENLQSKIKNINVGFEENKLVQTDLYYNTNTTLHTKYQQQITSTLIFLQNHFAQTGNYNLQNFIKKFTQRYEDVEVPLLELLDAVTGIGYTEAPPKSITPLIDDIIVYAEKQNHKEYRVSTTQHVLLKKLIEATANGNYSIDLKDDDFEKVTSTENYFPPSLSCMCKIVNDETLQIDHFSGSSAANLLGRFGFGSAAIKNILTDITDKEQKLNEDIIFAEIIHLPENRVGNILQHPPCREYEIVYLGKSSLPEDKQILLQDIMVSVRNGIVVLRSKPLGKRIIPRLSNAHNYSYNALPVYQFLCDMQNQELASGLSFHWGELSSMFTFLPRVIYNNTIISEATWQLDDSLLKKIKDFGIQQFQLFAKQQRLPKRFVLADGDNELLVDTTSELSINVFLDAIKNRNTLVIKEFLGKEENAPFPVHEFIVPLINDEKVYNNFSQLKELPLKNYAIPGSKWVYYKLYCGINDAEIILKNSLPQLIEALENKKLINSWFFIRYNDPNFHLRLRLELNNVLDISIVMQLCTTYFEKLVQDSLIWNVQLDMYKKEQHRYKLQSMHLIHQLFCVDSSTTLQFIQHCHNEEERWIYAWKKTCSLLDVFNLTLEEKENLMLFLKNSFGKEHHFKKQQTNEISRKFKIAKPKIDTYNNDSIDSFLWKLTPIVESIQYELKNNKETLIDLLASIIHMLLNRIFITNSRLHEAVLYDLMHQYYKTIKYKQQLYVVQ